MDFGYGMAGFHKTPEKTQRETAMTRAVKVPKDMRSLARRARQQGWEITRTNGGHLRWRSPNGVVVIMGSTPNGGKHSDKNAYAAFKREGLE